MNFNNLKANAKNPFVIFNLKIIIISIVLAILNNLILKKINLLFLNSFFNGYFNDLLGAILILAYINLLLSIFLNYKIKSLKLLIIITVLIAIVWEYVAIFLKPSGVSDILDVFIYLLGCIIYWRIIHGDI
ncbi:MAG: hypothetical protein LBR24_03190 [Methanobrevibacter sp.]|jgi:hypothetical protein|nr:hypothetical protein [Methanobrevibacter sp.]